MQYPANGWWQRIYRYSIIYRATRWQCISHYGRIRECNYPAGYNTSYSTYRGDSHIAACPGACWIYILQVNYCSGIITGTLAACIGATTLLSDAGGGTWASSSLGVATIGLSSGIVTGASAGTATVTYSLGGTCVSAIVVTINSLPPLSTVSGGGSYCAGGAGIHVFCGSSAGLVSYQLYSGGIPIGSPMAGTGSTIDFGLQAATGIYIVVATNTVTGCSRNMAGSATVNINSLPAIYNITGGGSFCAGGTGVHIGLSDSDPGITYQLYAGGIISGSGIAGTGSALDFGAISSAGTYAVIATNSATGCTSIMSGGAAIAINPLPASFTVSGGGAYCSGGTAPHVTLSSSATGVNYQLFNGPAAAGTPVAGTGSALNFGPAPAAGTYTVIAANTATTCARPMAGSATVAVNPLPVVAGPTAVCVGASLAETAPGFTGSWSSSTTSVATVGSASGIVYGVLTGATSTITFTSVAGCTGTAIVTVSSSPGPVIGPSVVCQGSSVKDSDIISGGSWSSSNTAIATVALTGFVYGVATGPVIITYSLGSGCTVTKLTTVTASPAAITGAMILCSGTSSALADATLGGAWSSGNTDVATVSGAGTAWGVSPGTTTISYTSGGCSSSAIVTVNTAPAAIAGPSVVCAGLAVTETDVITGGSWVSSSTSVATINPASGVLTGGSFGTATITYSLGAGCSATRIITVTAGPSPITGPTGLCLGAANLLGEASPGGAWSSSATGIASVNSTGTITGLSVGTATIIYSLGGCTTSLLMTVNPAPGAIAGATSVCTGSVTAFSNISGGGIWTSSNTAVATADGAGGIWGVAPGGIATISYSLGGACIVTKGITVNPVSSISGSSGICVGATTTLTNGTAGGTWHSGNTAVATISAAGVVHGVSPGTSAITYTTALGCTATVIVTVNTAPSSITGTMHVCAGSCTPLANVAGGGVWSSSSSIATVDAGSGLVCGTLPGTATITYSLGFGCVASTVITVNPLPAAITGVLRVCAGAGTTLNTITTGGVWSSSASSIATINASAGTVLGLAAGTSGITYLLTTGCSVAVPVTVNPLPQPITGTFSLCAGTTLALSDATSGGTWASGSAGIATADASIGTVSGIAPGTSVITYTLTTGCQAIRIVTINATPPPISGSTSMCVTAATDLSDAVSGGFWESSNSSVAAVSSAGNIAGMAIGTSTISYTVSGCAATAVITVNSLPAAISGIARVCVGATTALTDVPSGGSWSSSLPGVAIINEGSGLVTGEAAGFTSVTYSLGVGCSVTAIVTVDALPAPVTGIPDVCLNYTSVLSDASGGGIWSSSSSAIAPVSSGGVVTGLSGGPATISYTNSHGCYNTRVVTVIVVPAILGMTNMCAYGVPQIVYDSLPGGVWTSTSASISSTGIVTAYAAGIATVTYTLSSGCFTSSTFTVNPTPGPVVGVSHLCAGQIMTVSDTTSGGSWSSSNSAVAPVSTGGFVTTLLPGTATLSYTIATGCNSAETITVYPHPSAIAGSSNVCAAATITLTDTVGGGSWSSSNILIASITSAGVVNAGNAGVTTITYSLASSCSVTRLITVNPLPAPYTVTGGGSYCDGGAGVHIGLSGSNIGVGYRLYNGGVPVVAISGTGATADFGLQAAAGTYTVIATSTITNCASNMPGGATVAITPTITPSVLLNSSVGDIVCAGLPVTFTALSVNGGPAPLYQWSVSGTMTDSVSNTFSYTPVDNDAVTVHLHSSASCAAPDTAVSDIVMTVVTPPALVVSVTATPGTTIKAGDNVSFSVDVTNGSAFLTYQWVVNNMQIPGATTSTYSYNNFANGDSISCMITSAGFCNLAGSGSVIITINDNSGEGVTSVEQGGEISVLPNPNRGSFVIKGTFGSSAGDEAILEITDLLGQVVYKDKVVTQGGKINISVTPGNALSNGMYLLSVRTGSEYKVFHIVVER